MFIVFCAMFSDSGDVFSEILMASSICCSSMVFFRFCRFEVFPGPSPVSSDENPLPCLASSARSPAFLQSVLGAASFLVLGCVCGCFGGPGSAAEVLFAIFAMVGCLLFRGAAVGSLSRVSCCAWRLA